MWWTASGPMADAGGAGMRWPGSTGMRLPAAIGRYKHTAALFDGSVRTISP